MPKKLEFKASIGHYGGYLVDVPITDVKELKSMFGRSFPRRAYYSKGDASPKQVFRFTERSKGIQRLEELERIGKVKLRFPDYTD